MQEKLNRLKALVQEADALVDGMIRSTAGGCTCGECACTQHAEDAAPQQEAPSAPAQVQDTGWDYGHWKDARTYDDIKEAMVAAQAGGSPLLVALSKPSGCTNCLNYWRHVTCDGVLNHDKSCAVSGHQIVAWAQQRKVVMLYISPSRMPNVASKITGKEYDKWMHKPAYYPVYMVLKVKEDIDLSQVPANDKILNVGNDAGDTVDFLMGYIGLAGKPVLDSNGNQTDRKVKTDSTGWQVFKDNFDALVGKA